MFALDFSLWVEPLICYLLFHLLCSANFHLNIFACVCGLAGSGYLRFAHYDQGCLGSGDLATTTYQYQYQYQNYYILVVVLVLVLLHTSTSISTNTSTSTSTSTRPITSTNNSSSIGTSTAGNTSTHNTTTNTMLNMSQDTE